MRHRAKDPGPYMKTNTALGILFVSLLGEPLHGQDLAHERLENWHHWRGPEADGTAPLANPPIHWDAKTNIRWKAPLPGRGSSTPIVWNDQVFVLTAIETDRIAEPGALPKQEPRFPKKTT